MKPCPDRQKPITWLALDSLDAPSAQELRAHLEICPGCRRYLAEMSRVTGQIAAAAPAAPLPSSDTFHRQVMIRIKAEASASAWEAVVDSLRATFSNWRVALPIAAVLVALLAVGIGLWPHSAINVRPPSPVVARQVTVAPVDLAPTIANYQQVANQSLEKLDDLLVREGKQTGGPAQVCTASTMVLNF